MLGGQCACVYPSLNVCPPRFVRRFVVGRSLLASSEVRPGHWEEMYRDTLKNNHKTPLPPRPRRRGLLHANSSRTLARRPALQLSATQLTDDDVATLLVAIDCDGSGERSRS